MLKATLAALNYRNLDEVPEFTGKNTTTEFLAKTIFDRVTDAVRAGTLGPGAVARGLDNLAAHLDASACFERPVVVAINRFPTDTPEEDRLIAELCESRGVAWAACEGVARGALHHHTR